MALKCEKIVGKCLNWIVQGIFESCYLVNMTTKHKNTEIWCSVHTRTRTCDVAFTHGPQHSDTLRGKHPNTRHPFCRHHLEGSQARVRCDTLTKKTVSVWRVTNQRMTQTAPVHNPKDELCRLVRSLWWFMVKMQFAGKSNGVCTSLSPRFHNKVRLPVG